MMKTYMAWADKIRAEGRHKGGQKPTDDAGNVLRRTGGLMAARLIASIPTAIVYNLSVDRFVAGFTVGAIK